MSTHAFSQKRRPEQPIGFHHRLPGRDPCQLTRVEPGTCGGQNAGQQAHVCTLVLDLADGAHRTEGFLPEKLPRGHAWHVLSLATPLPQWDDPGADRTTSAQAQRPLCADWRRLRFVLPEDPGTGTRVGIRVTCDPRLLHQAQRLVPGRAHLLPYTSSRNPIAPQFC